MWCRVCAGWRVWGIWGWGVGVFGCGGYLGVGVGCGGIWVWG